MDTFNLKEDIKVFGLKVEVCPRGIGEAFDALVQRIPGGFNRSYYGIGQMSATGINYIAAALETYDGEAEEYNLDKYIIEKGEYLTSTLHGWRQRTDAIKSLICELIHDTRVDREKPCVEWYKDDEVMICMMRLRR